MKHFYKKHNILGKNGEILAQKYYKKKGFKILNKNVRTKNSEIDFVAYKDQEIIFVEVKTIEKDTDIPKILGEDNFNFKKRKFLKRAIEQYLFKNKITFKNLKIDLACVYYHTEKQKWSIKLYENLILD